IKPANILVSNTGQVKVGDFGIARVEGQDFTQTGVRLGTPAYMSPEQIQGHAVDGRSDLFSLGGVRYEILAGDKPFRGKDMTSLPNSILNTDPPALRERNPAVQPALDAVAERALAKDPNKRSPDARAFAEDLERAIAVPLGSEPVPAGSHEQAAGPPRGNRPLVLIGAPGLLAATA